MGSGGILECTGRNVFAILCLSHLCMLLCIIFGHVFLSFRDRWERMLHAWRVREVLILLALLSCHLVWAITTQNFLTFIVHCMISFCCLHEGTLLGKMHRTVRGNSHCHLHTTLLQSLASQSCLPSRIFHYRYAFESINPIACCGRF